jgi:hypothetical protein
VVFARTRLTRFRVSLCPTCNRLRSLAEPPPAPRIPDIFGSQTDVQGPVAGLLLLVAAEGCAGVELYVCVGWSMAEELKRIQVPTIVMDCGRPWALTGEEVVPFARVSNVYSAQRAGRSFLVQHIINSESAGGLYRVRLQSRAEI